MDCLFCKIAHKEIAAAIVYEDDTVIAFLDIHPCAPGHTVIIPKRHYETVLELPQAENTAFLEAIKRVEMMVQKALAPHGFTIGINQGKPAGQFVDHVHVHVIPRWRDDGGGSIHSIVSYRSKEPLEEIKNKILKQI